MDISQHILRLEEIVQWQYQNIEGVQVPSDTRTRVVVGLLHLALEHERSVGVLSNQDLNGSVFALLRPLYEAYIRALWLRYCASDSDIEKFKIGKLDKNFGELIAEVEKVDGYDVNVLSDIKARNWKLMNDFTHGGISQAWGRNTANEITPNYPKKDVEGAIYFSVIVGLLATMEIANILKDETLARMVLDKMKSI